MKTKPVASRLRCAIYTRKSSEEGLEQSFNSLHAQREACEAYIKSQAHEGWAALPTAYDDGGYSGGSMERPGLRQLMADIALQRIDVVVVYKVDRLTRSLADFAKIVEVFDSHKVSFVSVTQQFNTTSSMGRLTLNVLLSFAQFEREVTGERIRDKIAASKAKGMWMGGNVPLGYDVRNRRLEVNEAEAETVRLIFRRYIELGSVDAVVAGLRQAGIRSKTWVTAGGRRIEGADFFRGAVYQILRNPLYVGLVGHGEKRYPGQHTAIVDQDIWDSVQYRISAQRRRLEIRPGSPSNAMFIGLLFDSRGNPMVPSYSARRRGGIRYRYYVSSPLLSGEPEKAGDIGRLAAGQLEELVLGHIRNTSDPDVSGADFLQRLERIEVHRDRVVIHLASGEIQDIAVRFVPKGGRYRILEARGRARNTRYDPALLKAVVRAHEWRHRLEEGKDKSTRGLARSLGVTHGYVRQLLPLAFLSPDVTEAIMNGRQDTTLSLPDLLHGRNLPLLWKEQVACTV